MITRPNSIESLFLERYLLLFVFREKELQVVVAENIPVNTVILRVPVADLDETSIKKGLMVSLSGASKTLFKTMITNGIVVIQVAKHLDRETKKLHVLHLTVEDHVGHKDSISVGS